MIDAGTPAPALRSLEAARRGLILVVSGYVVGATVVVSLIRSVQPGVLGWGVMAASVGMYAASVAFLKGEWQLRFAYGSLLALLILMFVVPDAAEAPWLPVTNVLGSLCYASILLMKRWHAWPLIGLGVAITLYAYTVRPSHALLWAPPMPEALFVVVQLVLACTLLWWMWRRLWRRAEESDALTQGVHEATQEAVRRQERARAWRRSAIEVHESVLNTLRYVLGVDQVDRERLMAFGASGADEPKYDSSIGVHSLANIVEHLRSHDESSVAIRLSGVAMSEPMAVRQASVLRNALAEIARNAEEHGRARNVTIHTALDTENSHDGAGQLTLSIVDDGRGVKNPWRPGIGLRHAVCDPIEEIGGTVELAPVRGRLVITIKIPLAPTIGKQRRPKVPFDTGRLTISAALVGWVIGGVAVAVWLIVSEGWQILPSAGLFLIAAFAAARVLFAKSRPAQGFILMAAAMGAVIPTVLAWVIEPGACIDQSLFPAFLNASGYAVLALVLWLRSRVVLPLVIVGLWTVGGTVLLTRVAADCRPVFIAVELNTLFVVPLLMVAAYYALRSAQNQEEQLRSILNSEAVEMSRAEAQEFISAELSAATQEAQGLITFIAQGGQRDDTVRQRLKECDARIRAIIQVDPHTTGPVGLVARHLVEYAVDSGTQVSVRAIDARSQTRAFPDALIRELENVVAVSSDIAIQVTDIGSADLLSLALGGVAREYVESTLRSVPSWMTWEIVEILEFEDTTVHILITCPSHDADPQSASTQLV